MGAAIASAALATGDRVAVTARDHSRLTGLVEAYPEDVLALSMDLADRYQIEAAVAVAEGWYGGIDVLVNNAAIGYLAAIEEGEDKKIRSVFETNVFGTVAVIRAALPRMRARARGMIINISSMNGVVSMPGLGYYSASKHALEGINDALAQEVAPLGIKVMSIEPGGFRTGIAERNLRSPRITDYGATAHTIMDFLTVKNEDQYAPSDPVRMADIIVDLAEIGHLPRRLSMGADSWTGIMDKLDSMKAEYDSWKDVSVSTYFR